MFENMIMEKDIMKHLEEQGYFEYVGGSKVDITREYAEKLGYKKYKLSGFGEENGKYIYIKKIIKKVKKLIVIALQA